MKRFSDISQEDERLDGAKIKLDDILGTEITIHGFTLAKSNFSKNQSGQYLTVQFSKAETPKQVFFTGSDVLIAQMQKYKCEMPFLAIIKKINKYYTLT